MVNLRSVRILHERRPGAWLPLAALLFFTLTCPALYALPLLQAPADPPPTPTIDLTSLNGKVEVTRLVDLAAAQLKLNIEYDAGVLDGTVTLRLGSPLTNDELWALTNHVLASRGFTTVRGKTDGILSVVKVEKAPTLGRIEDPGGTGYLPGFLTVATKVEHIAPKDAIDALKLIVKGPASSVSQLGSSSVLLITDERARVDQALELLPKIDVEGSGSALEVVPTENVPAASLATSVNEIEAARESLAGRSPRGKVVALPDGSGLVIIAPPSDVAHLRETIRSLDARETLRTETYAPRYFSVDEVAGLLSQVIADPKSLASSATTGPNSRFRVVPDPLTGTLVITGTAAQHEKVRALFERLDAVPPESRKQVRSFGIKNRPVTEIVELLEKLITVDVFEVSGDASASASARAGDVQQTTREFGPPAPTTETGTPTATDSISRTPTDSTSNRSRRASSSATGEDDAALKEPPISLAADPATNTLLAIGEPRLLTQLDLLVKKLDVRQPQVMLEVMVVTLTDSESLDLGIELEKFEQRNELEITLSSLFGLSSTGDGTGGTGSGSSGNGLVGGSGFTGLVLRPGDYSVLLRALGAVNEGKSRNLPKVLVNNNEEASFDAVLQQPFLSTNASDTVATTSFGGTQDAGTSVKVKPQIAEGDQLRLEYTIALSEFVGESTSPSLPPPRQQNTLASIVTIPDGSTVILGGLEVETDADASTRIPWLADFPVIGFLFENRSTSRSKSRFYLFIRAEVMRNARYEDLRYFSAKEKSDAALDVDDGPVVEPRIIR